MATFRAMDTDVTVVGGGAGAVARVVAAFAEAERRFSRFRADSELAQLNRSDGPVTVSAELFGALVRARAWVERTDGLFDPGVGATLAALGYDRSFDPRAMDRERAGARPRAGRFLDVALDAATGTVTRPPHLHLDLGGMIKGATVDAASDRLEGAGAIDAGGDARVRGRAADGGPWLVDVEDPRDARRTVATLALTDAAVATSAANRRAWSVGALRAHHLIDPRTQAPAVTDLLQASVVAPTAERADVLAKAAFVAGRRGARDLLAREPDVGAVLVGADGAVTVLGSVEVVEGCRG